MGLEGMKGLLIMYVMVHHLSKMTSVPWITAAMHHGSVGVDPFFVLSGFVLMRSYIAHGATFERGVGSYLRRRMGRLVPSYYAGLVFSCVVASFTPFYIVNGDRMLWGSPSVAAIGVHLVFLQNVFQSTLREINDNYWFFAMEVQLSLLFPILAYVWKKTGAVAFVAVVAAAIAGWFAAFGPGSYFLKPEYLELFAGGMLLAGVDSSSQGRLSASRSWPWFAGFSVVLLSAIQLFRGQWIDEKMVIFAADSAIGVVACCAIMMCMSPSATVFRSVMEHPYLCWLGSMSYVLFLIHTPILRVMQLGLLRGGVHGIVQFALLATVGIACTCVCAIAFRNVVGRWARQRQ